MNEHELPRMMDECMAYDDDLRAGGHFAGGEALVQAAKAKAKTHRFRNGTVLVTDGPDAETKEQIGGILILEADSMAQAVELMSKHPRRSCRSIQNSSCRRVVNNMIAARERQFRSQT